MIIVIDGYNLLHAAFEHTLDEHARDRLIKLFNQYVRIKNHQIVLVFDAGPFYWSSAQQEGRVEVIFSGQNQSADQYIKQYLSDYRSKDILLVSSDRDICYTADTYNIPSIGSAEFYKIIQQSLEQKKQKKIIDKTIVKLTENSNELLDQLMMESPDPLLSQELSEIEGLIGKKESKKDRKLWQKIKKL